MGVNIEEIINQYYPTGTLVHDVLMRHSARVAAAAVQIAGRVSHLGPDVEFIREASMLHDIGIFYTNAPAIGCYGEHSYLGHGYLGRMLLEEHGLPDHARVCETHVGVGLTAAEIIEERLGLPARDMIPESIEEQIICYADTFFSKTPPIGGRRHTADAVIASLEKFGTEKVGIFTRWLDMFGEPDADEFDPSFHEHLKICRPAGI